MSLTWCRRAQTALDAQAEGQPGKLFGIVADGAEDVGIDHARPAHLDPVAVPAHVHFHARLGEGEERRAEADVNVVLRKKLRPNSRKMLFRSAIVTRRSTSRPSIWWNMG